MEIFKGLLLSGSFKFHNKQFKKLLETTTEKPWEDKISKKKEIPKEGAEEEKEEL